MNAQTTNIYNCNVFELPKEHNRAGNLTAVNNGAEIPFEVKRVYYIYDIPSGVTRGGHAHKELYQYIIAASSSFDVLLDDGRNKKIVHLDRPNFALQIVPGIWRELLNFSSGAICMVLASEKYNEPDYIREYSNYLLFKQCK
ncbi:MAG: FdtA/QdtA family cupin domain-containing protein [Bacteroides sp.]